MLTDFNELDLLGKQISYIEEPIKILRYHLEPWRRGKDLGPQREGKQFTGR